MLTLQSISKFAAHLCLSAERFLLHDLALSQGGSFVVGVSGGADSVALLHILYVLSQRWNAPLYAVHVDHALRKESASEAVFVKELCRKLAVPCHAVRIDVSEEAARRKTGLEDAGRAVRYETFEAVRRECGAAWIATAHHAGDLEEDILLRLLRGAGWPSLGGMPALDEKRFLVRPLLWASPQDLRAFLKELGVSWVEDASNAEALYKRNRVRHDILPLLHRENPSFQTGMQRLWRQARIDDEHWESLLEEALLRHPLIRRGKTLVAEKHLLHGMDAALRLRLYKKMLTECGGQIRFENLYALENAWASGRGNVCLQFPGNVTAQIIKGSVVVASNVARQQ